MPRLTPLTSIPATPPSGVADINKLTLTSQGGLDIELVAATATVSGRPYFWVDDADMPGGGAWIGLHADGISGVGTTVMTADPTKYGGSAHAPYPLRAGTFTLIFVLESGLVANVRRCYMEPTQRAMT